MKKVLLLLFFIPVFAFSEALYSPSWGFKLDLPEGYEYLEGDGRSRFSFGGPADAKFDIIVYDGVYANMEALTADVNRRLANRGDFDYFTYRDKLAVLIELNFGGFTGWGLGVELAPAASGRKPILLALSYNPQGSADMGLFHMSALDSIAPSDAERFYPGPIMEFSFPRGEPKQAALAGSGITSVIHMNDAEAAQNLIEREFNLLLNYQNTPFIREAWLRYYRFIFRDSYGRISEAASALAASWGGNNANTDAAKNAFAQRALTFVQGFNYERDFSGSDFLNLVTAITEGRGDCDSRAMLWAVILNRAGIRSAIMVSPHYGHAMGLADIAGEGARFEAYETRWLVAETTDRVNIGLIAQDVSDPAYWIGVIFE